MTMRRQADLATRIAALPVPTIVGQVVLVPEISEIVAQVFDLACSHLGEGQARSLFAEAVRRRRGRPRGSRRRGEPGVKLKRLADNLASAGLDPAEARRQIAEIASAPEMGGYYGASKPAIEKRLRRLRDK